MRPATLWDCMIGVVVTVMLIAGGLLFARIADAEPGFYVGAGVAAMDKQPDPSPVDRAKVTNPYGIVEIGYEGRITTRTAFVVRGRHLSSIPFHGDHGDNTAELMLIFRPFNRDAQP